MSPADTARTNGWTVGTRLVGDEGYGETMIEITAIGRQNVLAVTVAGIGYTPDVEFESSWAFSCRNWRVVDALVEQVAR